MKAATFEVLLSSLLTGGRCASIVAAMAFKHLLLKTLFDSTFREARMEWEVFSSSSA
jgi:uncharacterized membrane protein YsdA (DUF1294 family)